MAKDAMICPFSGSACRECPIYRGRHYYLCFDKRYRGHVDRVGQANNRTLREADGDIEVIPKQVGPFGDGDYKELRLKVIDTDTSLSEYCDIEDAKNWDYGSHNPIVVVDGRHITSWDKLIEVLSLQGYKDSQEVAVHLVWMM